MKNIAPEDPWLSQKEILSRRVAALFGILSQVYGTDQLVLKASKVDALKLLRSDHLEERVLALEKLVYEDPTLDRMPEEEDIEGILNDLQEQIADFLARRSVEDEIERRVADRMHERHEDYINEIKEQLIRESAGPENAQTLKKLALLEKQSQIKLNRSILEVLRPKSAREIVGQERALRALIAKIASPFPQHVILYGPPGVGKTTAARIAMEEAKKLPSAPFRKTAPLVEVNGSTLRWDPREVTNPLLGSVHDPIYQGARRDLADSGIPEPKLGLVTEAHGGILFIDEIGEMDPLLLNKLLKVLEDKKVEFDSSYYDPDDERVPQYIRKLFQEGAPADFVLIGATTRDPEEISGALRSRCSQVFFEPLTPEHIQIIVRQAARKLRVELEPQVPEIVSEYTIEGRQAINLLADAYSLARYDSRRRRRPIISIAHVHEVIQNARLTPYNVPRASDAAEIGRIFGLGVAGFVGSLIEIEAITFPAAEVGHGQIRFNETAGSMARDSVFNAAAVIRNLTGEDIRDYDLHVNVVGGGNIEGPSAGAAICLAIWSAIKKQPLRQDVAVTGEISIQGKVHPVGGLLEKIFGARQAGIKKVLVPEENRTDIPADIKGIEIIPVASIQEAIPQVSS
ncbi:MAG: ATP-dependent protease, Lon family [Clostridia bacterium]|nr:MAG: ATP-dependent protease, Lon family [Clostridia bacterium]